MRKQPEKTDENGEDRVEFDLAGRSLLTPGGKVDPEAIRRAYETSLDAEGDDPEARRVTFILQRDHKTRLDKYLTSRVTFLSRSKLQRLITEDGVTVNGRAAKPSTKLRLSDRVSVIVPPPTTGRILPEPIPLEILYEDDDLVVVNKAANIIVHPARSQASGTMINALAWYVASQGGELPESGSDDVEDAVRPGVVHRLDRHTTGVIVFAKSDVAHWRLAEQWAKRTVEKRYLAIAHGLIEPISQTIDLPLGPHQSRLKGLREKQVVRRDELGKPSITVCHAIERYPEGLGGEGLGPATLAEMDLRTGRTHQIRVHLSHTGRPLVGDDLYGGQPALDRDGSTLLATQALHAALLAFDHPATGERMRFTAPAPEAFRSLVNALRASGSVSRCEPRDAIIDLSAAVPSQ